MKRLLLLVLIAILATLSPAQAEIPKEKRKEIDKMLEITGVHKLMVQMKKQVIDSLKEQMENVPPAFWEKFEKGLNTDELIEKMVPLYDKYYTIEDLKAVNAFYESEAGKKVLANLPQIMQESMKIGQEWGSEVAKKAAEEVAKDLDKQKDKF